MILVVLGLGPVGCACKIDPASMSRPQRPIELDRLDALVGTWKTTAVGDLLGVEVPLHSTGESSASWECDGWCIVDRSQFIMGELGRLNGVAVWTWDDRAGRYRTTWCDSFGDTDVGTARFDEKSRTWYMKSASHGAMGTTRTRGTLRIVDDRTLEWTFSERVGPFGMFQVMNLKGTSKKQ